MLVLIRVAYSQSKEQLISKVKIIDITTYKYDYMIKAMRLDNNDTIDIYSSKSGFKNNGVSICLDSIYILKLKLLVNLSSIAHLCVRYSYGADDGRALWSNNQSEKLIPYKALNLNGLQITPYTDTVDIDEYVYNKVYKNIAAYQLKYNRTDLNSNNQLSSEMNFYFDKFLPDYGYKLEMEIKKLPTEYPLDYELYQVTLEDRILYFEERPNIIFLDKGEKMLPKNRYYLIAINKKDRYIKFISGQFFTTSIAKDFQFDTTNPKTIIKYIELKLFNLQINQVEILKIKGNKVILKAYSNEMKKEVRVFLNIKHPENSLKVMPTDNYGITLPFLLTPKVLLYTK